MTDKIKRINNPLTIIAIFAALAEINATVAISLIDKNLHSIFIWFVIGFPTLLVILFFVTLNYNTKVMYSPSDYTDDKNFIDSLYGNVKISKSSTDLSKKVSHEIEIRINEKINEKLIKLKNENPTITNEIQKIEDEITLITKESFDEIKEEFEIPVELNKKLISLFKWPAFYNLIYAIVQTESKNKSDIKKNLNNYFIPSGWNKRGLAKLELLEIIINNDDNNFDINPVFKNGLNLWVNKNADTLKEINTLYKYTQNLDRDSEEYKKIRVQIDELKDQLLF